MKRSLSTTMLIFLCAVVAFSQTDPVDRNGVAVGGYDVVAYFQSGGPLKGNTNFQFTHNDATYYFSSKENLALFKTSPEKYIPRFDGYCALAVSYGHKISINPDTYKIIDDKLYLFFNGRTSRGIVNSLETWNKHEEQLLKKAESQWPDVRKKKYSSDNTL